jgi:O-antigen/teichoic acid export membrane protein
MIERPAEADNARAPVSEATSPTGASAGSGEETISRNAALAFAAQLVGAAFTAGLTLFLARQLGSHGFGVFSLALGIGGLVLMPSDFGISTSAARFVAEHRGEQGRVLSVLADALRLKLLVSTAIAVLLIIVSEPIADAYGIDPLVWPIRGVALALFGQSLMMMTSAFVAAGRVRFQLWTATAESAVETTATVGLVLAGAGVSGAAFGRSIGYAAGAAMTLFALVRLFGPKALPRTIHFGPDTRRIASYAGVLLIIDGAFTLFNEIDVLIIGGYLGASAVGVFSAPLRLISFLSYPGSAIAAGVSPRLARHAHEKPNVDAFVAALRLLLILEAAITAFVLGWSSLLVEIGLGGGYKESATVLRVLAPCVFLMGFGPLVSVSANYLGAARQRVPIAVVTVAINFALDIVLVPRIGVVGGAIGTDVAYGLYAPAHLLICQRILHLDLRPTARTLLRALLAGAAMTGLLLAIGGSVDDAWRIPLGGLAGVSAFAGLLWLTGETNPHEAMALLRQVPVLRRALPSPAAAEG